MIRNALKAMTAVAAVGMILLGGSQRAAADILITVSSGASTQTADIASNAFGAAAFTSVGGYSVTVQTVIANYPGSSNQGQISTTVNVGTFVPGSANLVTTVQLVNPGTGNNLVWNSPGSSPVNVSAATSFTSQVGVTAGTVTTATYYSSPPLTSGIGAATVSQATGPGSGTPPAVVSASNSGTYSLSQTVTLSGAVSTASSFNFGGTSSVTAVPEPSSMAIAGLGALGMIGYGLRRRKALGA